MSSKLFTVALFIVIICNVCPINTVENPNHNYDIANLIQHASSRVSNAQTLNQLAIDNEISLIDEFKWLIPEKIYVVLIDILKHNGSIKCIKDLIYVTENIKKPWTLQMFDSFGKPERGLMQGNVQWLGEYDECLKVYAPPKYNSSSFGNSSMGNFHGQYCNMQVTVNIYDQPVPISIGACLPDTCEDVVINDIINITTQILSPNATTTAVKLTCNAPVQGLTTAAICVIFLLSIFLFLAFIGSLITAYEKFANIGKNKRSSSLSGFEQRKILSANGDIDRQSSHGDDDNVHVTGYIMEYRKLPVWIEKVNPFFNCFCLFTNGAKLLDTSSSEGQLPCLHGIRFLSLSWVIVCHTFAFSLTYTREMLKIIPKVDHWPFQIIMNGFYSVDSFFLLSGFLLAYLFFELSSKTGGKVPWVYFYVHRYIRLTPVYMIMLAFYTTIYPYLSSGPLWTTHAIDPNCGQYWWRNLLYINNFFDSTEMCVGWSWYLSNDMQFFVISPIFLVTLWKWPPVGVAVLAFFMNITNVCNFVIAYQYKLVAGLGNIFMVARPQDFMSGVWNDYFNKIYMKPYARISPYLVGIGLAYYLYNRKQNNRGKNSLAFLTAGWLIASTLTLACLFGLYHRDMSTYEMSLYNTFNRTVFALGLAWVIYVCLTGQGGFVNSILSYKLFIPLSRLTYCAYLVHPIVMYLYYMSSKSMLDFSHLNMVTLYLGFLVTAYLIAFITSLLFESPVIRLDKLVRSIGAKRD